MMLSHMRTWREAIAQGAHTRKEKQPEWPTDWWMRNWRISTERNEDHDESEPNENREQVQVGEQGWEVGQSKWHRRNRKCVQKKTMTQINWTFNDKIQNKKPLVVTVCSIKYK